MFLFAFLFINSHSLQIQFLSFLKLSSIFVHHSQIFTSIRQLSLIIILQPFLHFNRFCKIILRFFQFVLILVHRPQKVVSVHDFTIFSINFQYFNILIIIIFRFFRLILFLIQQPQLTIALPHHDIVFAQNLRK